MLVRLLLILLLRLEASMLLLRLMLIPLLRWHIPRRLQLMLRLLMLHLLLLTIQAVVLYLVVERQSCDVEVLLLRLMLLLLLLRWRWHDRRQEGLPIEVVPQGGCILLVRSPALRALLLTGVKVLLRLMKLVHRMLRLRLEQQLFTRHLVGLAMQLQRSERKARVRALRSDLIQRGPSVGPRGCAGLLQVRTTRTQPAIDTATGQRLKRCDVRQRCIQLASTSIECSHLHSESMSPIFLEVCSIIRHFVGGRMRRSRATDDEGRHPLTRGHGGRAKPKDGRSYQRYTTNDTKRGARWNGAEGGRTAAKSSGERGAAVGKPLIASAGKGTAA